MEVRPNEMAKQEMPPVPPQEKAFVPKETLGREALMQQIEQYKIAAQEVPFEEAAVKEIYEKRVALAEKQLEVFGAKHDNTGALKGEYLGQSLGETFTEKGFQFDAKGQFEKDPALEQSHLLFVNLGELDRINQEGDHHTGDQALQALKDKIERTVQSELMGLGDKMTTAYSIYRSGGSKFSVALEGVEEGLAEKIREQLDSSLDLSSVLPGKEAAPLAASRISLAEVYDVVDELPDEEKQQLANDARSSRAMISTAFEMLNQLNDKRETETRLDRLTEKIKSGDEEGARAFYTKFQARALTPMFSEHSDQLLSYEDIKEKLVALGALNGEAWADKKAAIALQEARRQFEGRRLAQRDTDRKISEAAAKTYIQFQEGIPQETGARYIKQEQSTFQKPQPTEGKREIQKLAATKQALEAGLAGKECVELGGLDADCQALEEARLDLEYEQAVRDSMTGLKQRGPLFETLEHSLENNGPVATVYIDMAFLKYFDKEGGRETGNIAIMKAGEILDKISTLFKERGKQVEAYRIGGDEFAFSVAGEDKAFLQEVVESLLDEQTAAGAVPLQGEAPVGVYADQSLQFNYGVFHAQSKKEMKNMLQEAGLALEYEGTEQENNELAEYMLRFADKQLEIQKAVARFSVLLQEGLGAEDLTTGKYAQLVKYSEKSIFGAEGKKKLEIWRTSMQEVEAKLKGASTDQDRKVFEEERAALMKQIELEATEFTLTQIQEKNKKNENYEGSIDKRIEEHVRDKFLEQKINTLEGEIQKLQTALDQQQDENKVLTEENASLKKQMTLLKTEKDQIATLREKIRG